MLVCFAFTLLVLYSRLLDIEIRFLRGLFCKSRPSMSAVGVVLNKSSHNSKFLNSNEFR